jgi:glycosyltransferase involved in cell wall biosynthesis
MAEMGDVTTVSVIMTVYNGERYLAQAIDSIRRQTLGNFEFIIVDDGSDDRTPEILAEAQADPRVKVIRQRRIGRTRALNVAWTQATGTYIANLDADDLAEPDRLEKQVTFLQQHPNVGLLGTACKILNEKKGEVRVVHHPLTDRQLRRGLVRRNAFVHSSVMIPSDVMHEVGGYDHRFQKSHDYELYIRIARRYQLANLAEVLTLKRKHASANFSPNGLMWPLARDHVLVRWQAWKYFSRSLPELRFVVLEPIGKWLYQRTKTLFTWPARPWTGN